MTDLGRHDKYFAYSTADDLRSSLLEAKTVARKMTVMKRIIANATMGNDMSALFATVVECVDVPDIEMKKMVYLYISNYGVMKKDVLTQCIDKFADDLRSHDPMTRVLALRTLSSLFTDKMGRALIDPVRNALFDKHAHVRKCAAMCVAKLHAHDAQLIERSGFIEKLYSMMTDAHADVITAAVAALYEISERSTTMLLSVNFKQANNLVHVMPRCTEWGQTYILEILLFYIPQTEQEAHMLADAISRHLQPRSPTLALAATKVAMFLMNYISDPERQDALCRWISLLLVQYLHEPPEILFTILKNVLLYVQRRPAILRTELPYFFCSYNDPEYIKLVKLDILYHLTTRANAPEVLNELQDCATEISEHICRKAIYVIGRLALKWGSVADDCMSALENIFQNKVHYALQESIVVVRDILRKYPDKYGHVIPMLCELMPLFDEPQAKVSMIWILGHFGDKVDGCVELLNNYTRTFLDEPAEVQLALMTASVKQFLRQPKAVSETVQQVLHWATERVANPDCRDRGYFYTRLLTMDAKIATAVVFAESAPPEGESVDRMQQHLVDHLLLHGSSLLTLLHNTQPMFIHHVRHRFLPDSPALEPSARPHASVHMHKEPAQYHTMHESMPGTPADDERALSRCASILSDAPPLDHNHAHASEPAASASYTSVAVGQLI